MAHNTVNATTIRRTSSALGAAAILGLALSGPALARPEPGPDASRAATSCCVIDESVYATHYGTKPSGGSSSSGSANAAENAAQQPKPAGPPAYNSWPNGGKVDTPNPDTLVLKPIGDSLELLQVALGALGGAVLTAAAAAAMASRSRHHVAHA
ncbi:MAG TPA: hypothetical protein VFX00_02550 [Pedococcus sp.]|jgi:hypothetical protein|nr:hypothetical protein [Pedococcus sp.]